MSILLERLRGPVHGTAPAAIAQEDPREAIRDLLGNLEEVHGWTGVVAKLIQLFGMLDAEQVLKAGETASFRGTQSTK